MELRRCGILYHKGASAERARLDTPLAMSDLATSPFAQVNINCIIFITIKRSQPALPAVKCDMFSSVTRVAHLEVALVGVGRRVVSLHVKSARVRTHRAITTVLVRPVTSCRLAVFFSFFFLLDG